MCVHNVELMHGSVLGHASLQEDVDIDLATNLQKSLSSGQPPIATPLRNEAKQAAEASQPSSETQQLIPDPLAKPAGTDETDPSTTPPAETAVAEITRQAPGLHTHVCMFTG